MSAEKISITEGKKHFLKLARLANQEKRSFTLTKQGKPFVQITPYTDERLLTENQIQKKEALQRVFKQTKQSYLNGEGKVMNKEELSHRREEMKTSFLAENT